MDKEPVIEKVGNFSREEVFGDIVDANFTVSEAAGYQEVSVPTFRR